MAHADEAHGLRVQLATALRERDEARALANQNAFVGGRHKDRADAAESERDALRGENGRLREALATHGRHLGACDAFPATSEEQIVKDCDCGLVAALAGGGDRG